MKQSRQVTLPIGNLKVFETLARGYAKSTKSEDQVEKYIQEMAKESYHASFNASLSDLSRNPHTPRLAPSFYDSFPEIFDQEKGWFAKASSTLSLAKEKIRGFKGSLVNITRLYLELSNEMKLSGKKGIFTDLEYPMLESRAQTEEDFGKLLKVEKARYTQMFAATLFTSMMWKIMRVKAEEIQKTVDKQNLYGFRDDMTNRQKFAHLKKAETREQFIESVKEGIEF